MPLKDKLLKFLKKKPSTLAELKVQFGFDKRIDNILSRLIKKGKIKKQEGKLVYIKPEKKKKDITTVEAVVVKHTGSYAFAAPLNGGDDYFIPGNLLNTALVGDRVLLSINKQHGKTYAAVLSISQPQNRVTGKVVQYLNKTAVQLDGYNGTIIVPIKRNCSLQSNIGECVAATIVSRKEKGYRCEVIRKFGSSNSAIATTKSIIFNQGLRTHFNAAIKTEVSDLIDSFSIDNNNEERIDLRNELIFTIDGADTKDIDDAVSLQKIETGWLLGVHIADVSHYVKFGTALENEAFQRQFSFYYPTDVIPMLPTELSNGICSLSPGEDRFCFSCIMEISKDGELISSSFVKTIIRSKFKGVYNEVNALLAGEADLSLKNKYRGAVNVLKSMRKLSGILNKRRVENGCIDFRFNETGFNISGERVKSIYVKKRGDSECMIEEFMLIANQSTASVAKEIGLPIVYRTHDMPNIDRLKQLQTTLSSFSNEQIDVATDTVTSKDVANIIKKYNDTPLEYFVNNSVLRSMSKAEYSTRPQGHFGLAMSDYCHFTSPIRRYADLFTHHILSDFGTKLPKQQILSKYSAYAAESAAMANAQEQLFMRTERTVDDCFKAEAMVGAIGEVFEGCISGVTEHSMFVLLDNTAEGRIAINDIANCYLLLDENYRLYSSDGSIEYKIGDRIKVRIVAVSVDVGRIDMMPETP